MCEGAQFPNPGERYLDHDPDDTTTNRYLASQSQSRAVPDYRRSFMDEIYAIIDGVAHGLGNAVVSRHLVARDPRIRILPRFRSMFVPVLLHHHKHPHYTALHRAAIDALVANCPALLDSSH